MHTHTLEKQVFLVGFSLRFPRFPCKFENRLNTGWPSVSPVAFQFSQRRKWSFPLRICSVNVTKSADSFWAVFVVNLPTAQDSSTNLVHVFLIKHEVVFLMLEAKNKDEFFRCSISWKPQLFYSYVCKEYSYWNFFKVTLFSRFTVI